MAQILSAEIEYNGPVIQVNVKDAGPPGPKGDNGVSPVVNTEEIENGTKVSITDAFGTKEFEVLNGKPGAEGTPGKSGDPGADGFSPIVSVEQTDTGVQISVTDKSGTTTSTVENGAPGRDGVDGVSPSVKVEQTDEGATVTVTDSDGTTTATVKNGTPGIDGGYYAPSVSEDGELNWTASKPSMPEIPSTNIKGPAGQDAPQINDNVVNTRNPWSSRKIVDTLAPAFESSGPVVTCNPVEGYPLNVVSQIVAVQSGSGDPSPDNVRPISGWAQATLTHNDTPITLSFGQTVYGGTLDWTTGVLTVNSIFLKLDTTYAISPYQFLDKNGVYFSSPLLYIANRVEGVCSHGICTTYTSIPNKSYIWLGVENQIVYWIGILDALGLSTVDEFKTWLDTQNVQIVYPMQEPITIQLTPQEILALSGTNTLYTDTGDTTVSGRADPNAIIQQLAARIAELEGAATNL